MTFLGKSVTSIIVAGVEGIARGYGEISAMLSDLTDSRFWHGFVAGFEHSFPPHRCLLFGLVFTIHAFQSRRKGREGLQQGDERLWRYRRKMVVAEGCFAAANLIRWAVPSEMDRRGLGGAWAIFWLGAAVVYAGTALSWHVRKPKPTAGENAVPKPEGWSPPRVR